MMSRYVGGCTFLFQTENLDGKDDNFCTYTHKCFFSILKVIVQFYPWLQISPIVPTRLVTYSSVVVSLGILYYFGVLQK